MDAEELIDYAALSELSGRSTGALRVMRSRGQLPEPDAPGPKWRRETLMEFLKEGARVPAADRSVAPAPRTEGGAPSDTPMPSVDAVAAPVTSGAPSRPAFSGEDAEDRRRRSMTVAEILACPHPADDRKRTTYAAWCLRCGRHQQGDSWIGAGYAGWSPALLATCPHPEAERRSHAWGKSCGVCGRLLTDPTP